MDGRIELRNQSQIELSGATVGVEVRAFNTSRAKLDNVMVHGSVSGSDGTTLDMIGGSVAGSVQGYNLTMAGGNVAGSVSVDGAGATGTISGTQMGLLSVGFGAGVTAGSIDTPHIDVFSSSTLALSDSTVTGDIVVSGGGGGITSLTVSGGSVGGKVSATGQQSQIPNTLIQMAEASIGGDLSASNATLSVGDSTISGDVSVQASQMLATIDLTGGTVGGSVTATGGISATRNAVVQISGTGIGKDITARDRSSITVVSGTVGGDVTSVGGSPVGSLVEIQGGSIAGNAAATFSGAELRLSGGTVMKDVRGSDSGKVAVAGGEIQGNLLFSGRATGLLTNGTVKGETRAEGFSRVNVEAGILEGEVSGAQNGTITATGGTFRNTVRSTGNSTIELSQLPIIEGAMFALDEGVIRQTGGSAFQGAEVRDRATLVLSGDMAMINIHLDAYESGIVSMAGGRIQGDLVGHDSSTLLMTGGTVTGDVIAAHSDAKGSLTVTGGMITGQATATEQGTLSLTGGGVGGEASAHNQAKLNVSGTAFIGGALAGNGNSTVNASGGVVLGDAGANDTSTLNLGGSASIAGRLISADKGTLEMTGGSVGGGALIQQEGKLNLKGGTIVGDMVGSGQSTISMTDGLIEGAALTKDAAHFQMTGGTVNGRVESDNTGQARGGLGIFGGKVNGDLISRDANPLREVLSVMGGDAVVTGSLFAIADGAIGLQGGTVGQNAVAGTRGTLVMIGGAVTLNLEAQDSSGVELHSGLVGRDARAFHNARFRMVGGTVARNLEGFNTSVITKSGGTVFGQIIAHDQCTVNLSGADTPAEGGTGPLSGGPIPLPQALALNITAEDGATVKFIGVDLAATLVDPNFQGAYSLYQLSGKLADGAEVAGEQFRVRNETGAQYKLVPFVPADLDRDGDVDADDHMKFQDCATGPAMGPVAEGCEPADLDADGDVDQSDFGLIQRCYGGNDNPPDPNCAK